MKYYMSLLLKAVASVSRLIPPYSTSVGRTLGSGINVLSTYLSIDNIPYLAFVRS